MASISSDGSATEVGAAVEPPADVAALARGSVSKSGRDIMEYIAVADKFFSEGETAKAAVALTKAARLGTDDAKLLGDIYSQVRRYRPRVGWP